MHIHVEDDYLPTDQFNKLYKDFIDDDLIDNAKIPWFYLPRITSLPTYTNNTPTDYQLIHIFYYEKGISPLYPTIKPLIDKLSPHQLIKIKANLRPKTPEFNLSKYHTDNTFQGGYTSIYYINDNDGYTQFQSNNQIIKSKANRLITFPNYLKHRGTSPTNTNVRMLININYFKRPTISLV